jgi:hypothetical protein
VKYLIAFGGPFFTTLAMSVGATRPKDGTDWAIAVIVAASAGFGGLAAIATNDRRKHQ